MAFLWLRNGGDPNHLLTGMILQVGIAPPKSNMDTQNYGLEEVTPFKYGYCDNFDNFGISKVTLSNIAGWKMDPDWRCISYKRIGIFQPAMLVYQRVVINNQ